MLISPVNLLWLIDPHDLHGMSIPNGSLGLEWCNAFTGRKADLAFSW
jgi:hypothetical protein